MVRRIIVVEDELAGVRGLLRRRKELERPGRVLPPMLPLTPTEALAAGRSGAVANQPLTPEDLVLLDCWDRDLPEDTEADFHTVLFALDVLAALRARLDAGHAVPRVAVYSRAMGDPLLRAALAEFAFPLRKLHVEGGDPVTRWRVDRDVAPHGTDVVLWAMFDTAVLSERLFEVVRGDRRGAATIPALDDPVYADFKGTSCFASFHGALRDEHPDVWEHCVLDGEVPASGRDAMRKALNRLGREYLEVDSKRGGTYKGLIRLARQMAQPPRYADGRSG